MAEASIPTPSSFDGWFPEELDEHLGKMISPTLPVEDSNRFLSDTLVDVSSLVTGDILLGIGDIGRRFMYGIIQRSTKSLVTDVAVVIRREDGEIDVFTVSDLDERFFHYPDYHEPLRLIQPLSTFLEGFLAQST